MILQEVSQYAPKKLKEMEQTLSELKKSSNNKNARLKLIQQMKEFTKIDDVVLFVDKELNAGVISVYKKNSLKNIVKTIVDKFSTKNKKISIEDLPKLTSVTENAEVVERIYIFIGRPLLKLLTPQEMLAVLLHEFGHVYSASSDVPDTIMAILKPLLNYTSFAVSVLKRSGFLDIVFELFLLYQAIITFLVHGISFTQRIGEKKADNYVVKYGYGDELVSVLTKFKGKEKEKPGMMETVKKFFSEILRLIFFFLNPPEHPSEEKRIKNLEDQIYGSFKKYYPHYGEVIDLVRADYRRQRS